MYQPSAETSSKARDILTRKIDEGRASAVALFERVHAQAPRDAIVRGQALQFTPTEAGDKGLVLSYPGSHVKIHRHALGQIAAKAGVPAAYLQGLTETGGWQTRLAADIAARHFHNGEANSRFLVRSVKIESDTSNVDFEARGFLSDKYRRLDSRPLLDAFAAECKSVGAVPVDGTVSDTRVALKAIVPTLYEPVPGEVLAFGVEWGNSDFGAAKHALRAFILRLWCLNGATMEDAMAQVHLGSKLSEDIELSQRTYDLDTKTSISALRDVVASTIAPKKIEMLCEGIKAANEKGMEWKNLSTKLAKRLLKSELQAARDAFESNDVVNLPAGKSVWRASNALSWIAGNTDDADRKLELQRFAGELLNGKSDAVEAAA